MSSGPLAGLRVLEFQGLGPAPMAAMLLSDLGATVLNVSNPRAREAFTIPPRFDLLRRGRTSIGLDLRAPGAADLALQMMESADCVIEGFRPGTMEKLGLGPDIALSRNPRLVYGRATGWGQDGPLSRAAGHDINYIGLAGALASIGRRGELPAPPLALVGDFGGGAMYLAFGLLAAIFERQTSGRGQVVDAAMVDGAASLMTAFYGMFAAGEHSLERGTNLLDSGSPFYDTYACADGLLMAVGAVEERFRRNLLKVLGLSGEPIDSENMRVQIRDAFASRPRSDWVQQFAGVDACVSEVLDMASAPSHSHLTQRQTFVLHDDVMQPAAAPRFSRTPATNVWIDSSRPSSWKLLRDFGLSKDAVAALLRDGVLTDVEKDER